MVFISGICYSSLKSTQIYPSRCSQSIPSFSKLSHYILYASYSLERLDQIKKEKSQNQRQASNEIKLLGFLKRTDYRVAKKMKAEITFMEISLKPQRALWWASIKKKKKLTWEEKVVRHWKKKKHQTKNTARKWMD